ncbi:MAG: DMT family transporter [Gloeomargaritaceae cyanobacterium C42_A2020_066]|nr:DMT family transporter [Gloeomargaritaceae cyanobacterium C42_A2020_066]
MGGVVTLFPSPDISHLGEWAALGAAGLWAVVSVLYRYLGRTIPPVGLNLAKNLAAVLLLSLTLGVRPAEAWPAAWAVAGLSLSGILGIALGDTAYFSALQSLGPRRLLLLETLSPPLGALLASALLGEVLDPVAWAAIGLTGIGITWATRERVGVDKTWGQWTAAGLAWGLFGAVVNALAALLSRWVLTATPIPPLLAAWVRLGAASLVLVFWGWLQGKLAAWIVPFQRDKRLILGVVVTAGLGSYLGIWLQQVAFKYAPVGIAQTLLATSPLLVLPLVIGLGERLSWAALMGVIVSLIGIALLFA